MSERLTTLPNPRTSSRSGPPRAWPVRSGYEPCAPWAGELSQVGERFCLLCWERIWEQNSTAPHRTDVTWRHTLDGQTTVTWNDETRCPR